MIYMEFGILARHIAGIVVLTAYTMGLIAVYR